MGNNLGASEKLSEETFVALAEHLLNTLEQKIEEAAEKIDLDVELHRQGNVLDIELPNRSKVIVNSNRPVQEIWVAARSGGFHFRLLEHRWVDTRSGKELFAELARLLSEQAGTTVQWED